MKKIIDVSSNFKKFVHILNGPLEAEILIAAIKLKVFDVLKSPISLEQLIELWGFDSFNTKLFLNALASMQIIKKENALYSNSLEANEFLCSSSEVYLGDFFIMMREQWHMSSEQIIKRVQNGKLKNAEKISSDNIWAEITRLSGKAQLAGFVQKVKDIILTQKGAENFSKMLDLGGGAGFVSIATAAAKKDLNVVLFDQPQVVEVAKKYISEYNLSNRVKIMGGNYIKDDIGSNYDIIWASMTFNFHKEQLETIIKKVYEALNPGGIFMHLGDALYNENTQPLEMLLHMFTQGITEQYNFSLGKDQIKNAMLKAGFEIMGRESFDSNFGELQLDIAKKS